MSRCLCSFTILGNNHGNLKYYTLWLFKKQAFCPILSRRGSGRHMMFWADKSQAKFIKITASFIKVATARRIAFIWVEAVHIDKIFPTAPKRSPPRFCPEGFSFKNYMNLRTILFSLTSGRLERKLRSAVSAPSTASL